MGTIGDMTVEEFVQTLTSKTIQMVSYEDMAKWIIANRHVIVKNAYEFDTFIYFIFLVADEMNIEKTLATLYIKLGFLIQEDEKKPRTADITSKLSSFYKNHIQVKLAVKNNSDKAAGNAKLAINSFISLKEAESLTKQNKLQVIIQAMYNKYPAVYEGLLKGLGCSFQKTPTNTVPTPDSFADLLKQKGQIILKGPPGTGKTRLAQLVAEKMTVQGSDPRKTQDENIKCTLEQREIIQFHPSYSYEDFIMGLEVGTNENGNIKYEMTSRGIKAFADLASLRKWQNFVLIIDEINRAPVSSVFGELMYALEYRGEEITLSSGEKMTLPKNLYIIGTMNTADRSIAELDYAMQRRFDFVEIPPTVPTDEDLNKGEKTKKHFAKNLYESIQGIFTRENIMTGIDPKDVQLGTSYFIYDGTPDHLNYKINYQIIPLLREYYKDGVFRKKQVMFPGDARTFQDYFQGEQLRRKLEGLNE